MKNLIIYGVGTQAELAYAYFEKDSEYTVVAFTIEESYLKETQFFGLPLYPFENIENFISPNEADIYVAIGPIKLLSLMENFCEKAKAKGYVLASYCSTTVKNFFEPSYGENCFIDNASFFQPSVKMGKGVTLSGAKVGHHAEIGNFSFLCTSIIGGKAIIEDYVFVGIGAIIREGVRIGKGSIIGMGCVITADIAPYSVCATSGTKARKGLDSRNIKLFRKT